MHFTTDGSTPTTSSPTINTPLHITADTTLKAIAVAPGFDPSDPTTAAYTITPILGGIANVPQLDETLIYNVATSTSFLYNGINGAPPLQTNMTATIEPERAAVVRGRVFQLDTGINDPPIPLQDVKVTILNHPEYGETLSRADGFFDLAVNGGGQLVVQFSKDNFLPSQRKVQVPWQDFAISDDVILIQKDQTTAIALDANKKIPQLTAVQGSLVTDDDGQRRATLIFQADTLAKKVLPDGSKVEFSGDVNGDIHIAATEYTIGPNGPMAMPAILPPTSTYTYMADFTIDEALDDGATSVEFDKPVYGYVDNFLDMITGQIVPNGYYDRVKGQWIPEENGIVLDIIDIVNNEAVLDLDGDGSADDPAVAPFDVLNFTTGELEKLADLYPNATTTPVSLWRVPMMHFSNFHFAMLASRAVEAADWNWAFYLLDNALQSLGIKKANQPRNIENCNNCKSSIIQVQAQIYGETVPITGTPFNLHYNSDRVHGYKNTARLNIPLIDPELDLQDTSLLNIQLIIDIAGRRFPFVFPKSVLTPGMTHEFKWGRSGRLWT